MHGTTEISHSANVGDRLFLQEQFGGLDSPVRMKPPLHNIVTKEVGE